MQARQRKFDGCMSCIFPYLADYRKCLYFSSGELLHESDIMANSSSSSTSRSTCLESASNSSSSTSRSSAVSLLSVLKAPTVSDLSRKQKIARNPAPVGKRRARTSGGSLMQQLCLIGPMLLRSFWPFNLPQLLQRECFHC